MRKLLDFVVDNGNYDGRPNNATGGRKQPLKGTSLLALTGMRLENTLQVEIAGQGVVPSSLH